MGIGHKRFKYKLLCLGAGNVTYSKQNNYILNQINSQTNSQITWIYDNVWNSGEQSEHNGTRGDTVFYEGRNDGRRKDMSISISPHPKHKSGRRIIIQKIWNHRVTCSFVFKHTHTSNVSSQIAKCPQNVNCWCVSHWKQCATRNNSTYFRIWQEKA